MFSIVLSLVSKLLKGVFNSKMSISVKSEAVTRRLLANSPFPLPLSHSSSPRLSLQTSRRLARQSYASHPHRVFPATSVFLCVLIVFLGVALSNTCWSQLWKETLHRHLDVWSTMIQYVLRDIRITFNQNPHPSSLWVLAQYPKAPHKLLSWSTEVCLRFAHLPEWTQRWEKWGIIRLLCTCLLL